MKEINELGDIWHVDDEGKLNPGEGETPDAHSMAELASKQITLHPEYVRNENLFHDFLEAFTEIMLSKYDFNDIKTTQDKISDLSNSQLNESKRKLISTFKRFF
jgi:predicted TPR repeat methyltransferase